MKKVIIPLTLLGLLVFTSCVPSSIKSFPYYYAHTDYTPMNRNSEVKKKREMKDFSKIKNPLVFSLSISDINYSKDKKDSVTVPDGALYVVVDLDTNKVFDFSYNESGVTSPLITTNTSFILPFSNYYTSIKTNDTKEKKVNVKDFPEDTFFQIANYNPHDTFIPLVSKTSALNTQTNTYTFINEENPNVVMKKSFVLDNFYHHSPLFCDNENNYFLSYDFEDYTHVVKFSPKGVELGFTELFSLPYEGTSNDSPYASYELIGVDDNYLYVQKYFRSEDYGDEREYGELYVYDKNKNKIIQELSIKYPGSLDASSRLFRVFNINGKRFVLSIKDGSNRAHNIYALTEFDGKGNKKVLFDNEDLILGKDVILKNNKLYLFDCWSSLFQYRYIDPFASTKEKMIGEIHRINSEEILKEYYK